MIKYELRNILVILNYDVHVIDSLMTKLMIPTTLVAVAITFGFVIIMLPLPEAIAPPPPLPPYASVVAGSSSVTVGSEETTFKLTAGGVIPEEADAYILDRGSLAYAWIDTTGNAVAVLIHPGFTDSEEEPWHAHASYSVALFSPFRICLASVVELGDYELEIEDDVITLEVNNFSINRNPPITYTFLTGSNNVVFDSASCPLSFTLGLKIISPAV